MYKIKPCFFLRKILLFILFTFTLFVGPWIQVSAAVTTLQFEAQTLDLDTGTINELLLLPSVDNTTADIKIGYHADRVNHGVPVPTNSAVGFAVIIGVSYANVTLADTSNYIGLIN